MILHTKYERSRLGSKKQQTRYITKFESRRRDAGTAVASFGDDLRLTAQRAYPEFDARTHCHKHFISSPRLSPEMKCRCIDRDCKTVEQAVEIVERYESIIGAEEKKKSTVRAVSGEGNVRRIDNPDVIEDADLMKQLQEVVTRLEKMESRFEDKKASKVEGTGRTDGTGRGYSECYI